MGHFVTDVPLKAPMTQFVEVFVERVQQCTMEQFEIMKDIVVAIQSVPQEQVPQATEDRTQCRRTNA